MSYQDAMEKRIGELEDTRNAMRDTIVELRKQINIDPKMVEDMKTRLDYHERRAGIFIYESGCYSDVKDFQKRLNGAGGGKLVAILTDQNSSRGPVFPDFIVIYKADRYIEFEQKT